jgi:hypothetical protein
MVHRDYPQRRQDDPMLGQNSSKELSADRDQGLEAWIR